MVAAALALNYVCLCVNHVCAVQVRLDYVADLLKEGKMYCHGYDKTGRPIIYLGTHQHDVCKTNKEKVRADRE